jgi:hypothetical protein
MLRLVLASLGVLGFGCATAQGTHGTTTTTTTTTTTKTSATAATPRFEVPLTFVALGGRTLPVPMVEVEINGVATRLIVDTGASDHVLTKACADAAHVAVSAAPVDGRDHAGETFSAARLAPFDVAVAGHAVHIDDGYVIDGPPPFQPLGIGGFLSPQKLFADGFVVLDFPASRLVVVDTAASATAWLAANRGPPTAIKAAYASGKPFVSVTVGDATVLAEVDTGGSTTEIATTTTARAGETACTGIGVSGKCVEGGTSSSQVAVVFAQRTFTLPVTIVESIDHAPDLDEGALLGMDVLRSCAIALPQRVQQDLLVACPQ